jgi:hypothetical protein
MYELLGALAFATLVTGYVLAVFFVRHGDDGFSRRPSVRHEGKSGSPQPRRHPSSSSNARAATRSSVPHPSLNQS